VRRFAACLVLVPIVFASCSDDDETIPLGVGGAGGGSTISVGGSSTSTSVGGGTPGTKENGEACTSENECLSDECWDGVCCNGMCSDNCESCLGIYSGVEDGRCGPIPAGTDPEGECDAACDGGFGANPTSCQLATLWSLRFGVGESVSGQDTSGELIGLDPAGNPYLVSVVVEEADFGEGPVSDGDTAAEGPFLAVTKHAETGALIRTPFSNSGAANPRLHLESNDVAVSSNGDLLVVGSFQGSYDFGAGTKDAGGSTADLHDGFVTRIHDDGSALAPVTAWAKHIDAPNSGDARATGVAIDGSGNVAVVGHATGGTVTFETGVEPSITSRKGFVARYDNAGAIQGSPLLLPTGAGSAEFFAAAYDGDSPQNLIVVGVADSGSPQQLDFGCSSPPTIDGREIVVVKFDSGGNCVWVMVGTGGADDLARSVVADGTDIYVSGSFLSSSVAFPNSVTLTNSTTSGGLQDGFLLKINGSGVPQWAQAFGDNTSSADEATRVTLDASGNVLTAGTFGGLLDLPGCSMVISNDALDAFLSCTTPAGSCCGVARWGGTGDDSMTHAVAGPGNTAFVTGDFSTEMDLGAGTMGVMLDGSDGYIGRIPVP
jgi:hypothetical protein